ncbi:SEC-C metal-binding domain-containing protein [Cohnella sp. GCM10012308]|uniref:SEC-C metal-binding domain-containing protein n=1 Tax=Cohnella sp. GCM10012308 TaxID=3317329 RepID=UPI00360B20F6
MKGESWRMLGRNDACPCGSGKKYKKCCIPKYDKPIPAAPPPSLRSLEKVLAHKLNQKNRWQPDAVERMSDDDILSQLSRMGITVDREGFLRDLQETMYSDRVAQVWQERIGAPVDSKDSIFPILAAKQFSKRWASDIISFDKLEYLADRMIEYGSPQQEQERLVLQRTIWDRLKTRFILQLGIRSWDELYERFPSFTDFAWILDDYSLTLRNAAVSLEVAQRMALLEERIALNREQEELFSDTEPGQRLTLRLEIAESYGLMDDFSRSDMEFEKIIADYPDSVWAYIHWGDLYIDSDRSKAVSIYNLGMERCQMNADNSQDLKDLKNRLAIMSQQ